MICLNVAAVVEDATKGSGMDGGFASLLSMTCRSIALALIIPDALETAEEATVQICTVVACGMLRGALQFTRQRCCWPRDMTVDALENFAVPLTVLSDSGTKP